MQFAVNRRFLIGLIITVIASGAAIHGLHAIQIKRQSGFLLENARRAVKEQQIAQGLSFYQQYAILAPDDLAAQAEFGLLLADQHLSQAAMGTLEKVVRNEPERNDLRRRLVEVEIASGHYRYAADHLDRYLLKASPQDPILWRWLGTCQIGVADYDQAVESLRTAIRLAPHEPEAYANLAEVLRGRLNRAVEANATMNSMADANPNSATAHTLFAEYLVSATVPSSPGREAQQAALREAQRAIELDPKGTRALLLAADLLSMKGDFRTARGYVQRAIESDPTRPAGYVMLAQIERQSGELSKAIDCLSVGLKAVSRRNGSLLWNLARLQLESSDFSGAQGTVDQMRDLPTDDRFKPLVGYLQAQVDMANQHWQQAVEGFEQAAIDLPDSPDLLKEARCQQAICQEKLGDRDLELAAYREAARVDPNWAPARLGVASTLLALGKLDESLDEYRQISRMDGMSEAGAEGEVKLLILKNESASNRSRNWDEVNSLLQQLQSRDPKAIGLTLLRADALLGQNHAAEAERILLQAGSQSPDKIELWQALSWLAVHEHQWDRTEKYLAGAEAKFGDQVWIRLARATYLVARYKQDSPSHLKPLAEHAEHFSASDRFTLYRRLAAEMFDAGNNSEAKSLARLACDADPKNIESRAFLVDLAITDGDRAAIERALSEIHGIEGEGPFWHYGQAALCLVEKPAASNSLDEAALQHLAIARKLRPGWAQVPLLTAQIEDRQGHPDAALADYMLSIDLGARSPWSIRRTVELLYLKQRFSEADRLLRDLEQNSSLFTNELGRMASEISARLEDLDRSLEIARRVAANSNDWRDHLWLGELLNLVAMRAKAAGRLDEAKANLDEAEKSLRLANKLEPATPATWLALVQFLSAADRKAEAESLIHKAEKSLPAKTSDLALAACYEAIGNKSQAADKYQTALDKDHNDPAVLRGAAEFYLRSGNLPKAELQLRSLVSGRFTAKPDDLAWGRRTLAAVLRSSGQYRKLEEALSLVRQNLAAASNSAEDRREEALELATFPEPDRRQQATKALEEVLQGRPADNEVRVALAGLYLAHDDWPKASEQLRALATNQNNDPRYMAFYVSRLLEHRETAEAELWLNRLDQLAPLEISTATLRAQSLAQQGNIDAAIDAVGKHFAQAIPKASLAGQLELAASSFEALARSAPGASGVADPKLLTAAEDYYRKLVKAEPKKLLVLAMFLARSQRYDESLAIVEPIAAESSPNALSELAGVLMGSGSDQASREQRIEKLLLAAIARQTGGPNRETAPLLLSMADLRMRQQRFDDAAKIYRAALVGDPSNVVAMNNLALLDVAEKSRGDEALELIGRAIALAGPLPALLDSRGSVYLSSGKPEQALSDFSQAVSEEPRPNRDLHRAMACLQLGQSDAATQSLADARKLGLDPNQLSATDRRDYQQLVARIAR